MAGSTRKSISVFLVLFVRILLPVNALSITYCASDNTGASGSSNPDIFQSDGKCELTCANYAFGIVQGEDCWCSNVAPGALVSNSECSDACPGYPDDRCGNKAQGLYGYYAIAGKTPTSTAGSSAPVTSAPPAPSSSSAVSTTPTTSASPIISVVTVSGQPTTIIVSNPGPTITPIISSTPSSSGGSSSLGGGAIAGIVIGSLIGVGVIIALLLWCWFLRRREQDKSPDTPDSRYDPSLQNTMDNRRQSRASQMSLMPNLGASDAPKSGLAPTDYLSPGGQSFIDNRMKKDAVLYPNGSRHSTVSLQDNQDYSRPVLRLTNPD